MRTTIWLPREKKKYPQLLLNTTELKLRSISTESIIYNIKIYHINKCTRAPFEWASSVLIITLHFYFKPQIYNFFYSLIQVANVQYEYYLYDIKNAINPVYARLLI